jgi:20S proteasome alpha/beta subunit
VYLHSLHFITYSGPALFYVDSDGVCVSGDVFSVGSGSRHAYSILDNTLLRWKADAASGMLVSLDEAVELAVRAIRHATHRDAFSGGYINVIHLTQHGCEHVLRVHSRNATHIPHVNG